MHSQKETRIKPVIFILAWLALLGTFALAAYPQTAGAPAEAAKPAASSDSAQPEPAGAPAAPAASPDTTAPRAADVNPHSFIIGTEDVLTIDVWKEPEISKIVPVRPDGMISLPLVGEIKATGLTPIQLQDEITASLKKVMSDPQVTVIVGEVHSLSFNIVGQVARPGYYPLTRRMTVLDALALAGGFRDFAKEKKIYVLRTTADGKQQKLRFNYRDVIKGKHFAQNIELRPRDTIVVP
jgi:polysaccharide biosynthesis/export protein